MDDDEACASFSCATCLNSFCGTAHLSSVCSNLGNFPECDSSRYCDDCTPQQYYCPRCSKRFCEGCYLARHSCCGGCLLETGTTQTFSCVDVDELALASCRLAALCAKCATRELPGRCDLCKGGYCMKMHSPVACSFCRRKCCVRCSNICCQPSCLASHRELFGVLARVCSDDLRTCRLCSSQSCISCCSHAGVLDETLCHDCYVHQCTRASEQVVRGAGRHDIPEDCSRIMRGFVGSEWTLVGLAWDQALKESIFPSIMPQRRYRRQHQYPPIGFDGWEYGGDLLLQSDFGYYESDFDGRDEWS